MEMAQVMERIDHNTKVARVSSALTVDVGGQLVALNIDQGVCYGLNRVATRIWSLIETPSSLDDAVAALCLQFDVTPEVCREDVLLLLNNLVEIGLADIVED